MQLLISSHLLAAKHQSTTVELTDIERAYTLFLDQTRSVGYMEQHEREFISGNEWENGVDGNDSAIPMQEIQA